MAGIDSKQIRSAHKRAAGRQDVQFPTLDAIISHEGLAKHHACMVQADCVEMIRRLCHRDSMGEVRPRARECKFNTRCSDP